MNSSAGCSGCDPRRSKVIPVACGTLCTAGHYPERQPFQRPIDGKKITNTKEEEEEEETCWISTTDHRPLIAPTRNSPRVHCIRRELSLVGTRSYRGQSSRRSTSSADRSESTKPIKPIGVVEECRPSDCRARNKKLSGCTTIAIRKLLPSS